MHHSYSKHKKSRQPTPRPSQPSQSNRPAQASAAPISFWSQFPDHNFIVAGRNSFRLGIPPLPNPYRNNGKRYADLWDVGYRSETKLAMRQDRERRLRDNPPPEAAGPVAVSADKLNQINRVFRTAA